MDVATVMSIIQTLLAAIQSSDQFKDVFSNFSSKSELESLQETLSAILSVLEDADAKQETLNSQEKNYIEKLRDAVYDAEDVLDEFLTLVQQNKLVMGATDDIFGKVKSFLSRFKPVAFKLSKMVKKVNKKLDGLVKSSQFSFKVDYRPSKFKRVETSCFLPADDEIIGREDDVKKILGMLLSCDADQTSNVCFISIVGMGGLGKSALAQLVYNDPRLKDVFEFKSWTCIADEDEQQWNVTDLLFKILKDLPFGNKGVTSLQQAQDELVKQLGSKKYLIVLDDVWTERYDRWSTLAQFLMGGQKGSRIVITTRSKKTAEMIAGGRVHVLQGLPAEESWTLFQRIALPSYNLIEIGSGIVKKCKDVPLAIRVVGSLLRGQSRSKWLSFLENGLANIREKENDMTHILKLSYHQLDAPLRSCFTHCALFPKDYKMEKEMLIRLWMAQGHVHTYDDGEDFFLILLQRCFFQDVSRDIYDEIISCKIHDLWHDIAEEAAGKEFCRVDSNTVIVGGRARHLSLMCDSYSRQFSNKTQIRTYLQIGHHCSMTKQFLALKQLAGWTCLRTLDLKGISATSLPESIGALLHLRYLDVSSERKLELLPKSIINLHNLQSLLLDECVCLKELPYDMSKLVNLTTLGIRSCNRLTSFPSCLGKLTRLQTLDQFIVGQLTQSGRQCFAGLEDLKALSSLRGRLRIKLKVPNSVKYMKEHHGDGAYLKNKEHLKLIFINFLLSEGYGNMEEEEYLLEELQPHSNLKELWVHGYSGVRMPRWPKSREDNSPFHLPSLVRLNIAECEELRCLPSLWKLPLLKELRLSDLPKVEYVITDIPEVVRHGSLESSGGSEIFPSLVLLRMHSMPQLKGWWPGLEVEQIVISDYGGGSSSSNDEPKLIIWASSLCLSLLTKLSICASPKMTCIPLCPHLEEIEVSDAVHLQDKILKISNMTWLKSMPTQYYKSVVKMILNDKKVLSVTKELFPSCLSSSLLSLHFESCLKLSSVDGWLENFSALEELCIIDCPDLLSSSVAEKDKDGGIPWQQLPPCLHSLRLEFLENLEKLPERMQDCTSLRSLVIWNCPQLNSLPTWLPKLTSLRKFQIRYCLKQLKERCQSPDGEDWPIVQHIPFIFIRDEEEEGKPVSLDDMWIFDEE